MGGLRGGGFRGNEDAQPQLLCTLPGPSTCTTEVQRANGLGRRQLPRSNYRHTGAPTEAAEMGCV